MLDARQIADIVRTQDLDGEVTQSTLHYYVQVGILPPAVGRGRSGYTPDHLARFRLARRLKRQGVGLAEIRRQMGGMTSEQVAAELSTEKDAAPRHRLRSRLAQGQSAPSGATLREAEDFSRYAIAAEALRARGGETPRTLRFRGGFSLQVPAGVPDQQIARLYSAIEAALDEEER